MNFDKGCAQRYRKRYVNTMPKILKESFRRKTCQSECQNNERDKERDW